MKKVATILANGFEEIEALTIVDVLRRAGIDCDLIGMEETVTGSHQITVEVDRLWNGDCQIMMESSYQVGCQEPQICGIIRN